MNDTPKYILQKQFEIIHAKPLQERIAGLFEMTELSRKIIQNQLKIRNPEFTEIELKIELFKAFYRFDFDPDTLNKIAVSMKQYWTEKQQNTEIVP